jgi:hypothetical protein
VCSAAQKILVGSDRGKDCVAVVRQLALFAGLGPSTLRVPRPLVLLLVAAVAEPEQGPPRFVRSFVH